MHDIRNHKLRLQLAITIIASFLAVVSISACSSPNASQPPISPTDTSKEAGAAETTDLPATIQIRFPDAAPGSPESDMSLIQGGSLKVFGQGDAYLPVAATFSSPIKIPGQVKVSAIGTDDLLFQQASTINTVLWQGGPTGTLSNLRVETKARAGAPAVVTAGEWIGGNITVRFNGLQGLPPSSNSKQPAQGFTYNLSGNTSKS